MILRLSAIVVLVFASCSFQGQERAAAPPKSAGSGGIPAANQPAGGTQDPFQILPLEAVRGTVFFAAARTVDPQGGTISWRINGEAVPEARAVQFKADDAKKGDVVQAALKLNETIYYSNAVTIMNSSPEIKTLKLLPENFKTGDTLSVEVTAEDRDGDAVTVSYEWTKNGVVAGKEARMPESVKRGDTVSVKLVPYDGITYGAPIVHDRVITNIPPSIQEHNDQTFDGTTYMYQVRAADADGDALNYKLESAVEGMSIDNASGLLTWKVPANAPKRETARIVVDDGHGGEIRYSLNISIQ